MDGGHRVRYALEEDPLWLLAIARAGRGDRAGGDEDKAGVTS